MHAGDAEPEQDRRGSHPPQRRFADRDEEQRHPDDGLVLIEWADRVERSLPREYLEICIDVTGAESRRFTIRGWPAARGGLARPGGAAGRLAADETLRLLPFVPARPCAGGTHVWPLKPSPTRPFPPRRPGPAPPGRGVEEGKGNVPLVVVKHRSTDAGSVGAFPHAVCRDSGRSGYAGKPGISRRVATVFPKMTTVPITRREDAS